MKNRNLFLTAMLAVTLAFGLMVMGCNPDGDDGDPPPSGGTFTVTGLETYNGKYIMVDGEISNTKSLLGAATFSATTYQGKWAKISGGKAEATLYLIDEATYKVTGYTGSDKNVSVSVTIVDQESFDMEEGIEVDSDATDQEFTVSFTNGGGTAAWVSP